VLGCRGDQRVQKSSDVVMVGGKLVHVNPNLAALEKINLKSSLEKIKIIHIIKKNIIIIYANWTMIRIKEKQVKTFSIKLCKK
jgi:hypothetical protein